MQLLHAACCSGPGLRHWIPSKLLCLLTLAVPCFQPTPTTPQDNLALHAINFLTAVSRSVHYQLFKDPTALRQICESIVIPNLKMRDDMVCLGARVGGVGGLRSRAGRAVKLFSGYIGELPMEAAQRNWFASPTAAQEEMFEMNWIEYVRRDTEGSDSDTRRRAASELVKSLTERFPAEVGRAALFRSQGVGACGWQGSSMCAAWREVHPLQTLTRAPAFPNPPGHRAVHGIRGRAAG